jgi:hypothetical protein
MNRERFEERCLQMRAHHLGDIPIEAFDPPLKVREVAARLSMSVDWTRQYFQKVPGVLRIPSPRQRGKRGYTTLLIPVQVFEREYRRFQEHTS